MKRLKDWEKDFIYLAYPEFSSPDIGKILNRSKRSIEKYVISNHLKKKKDVNINDEFGRLIVLSFANEYKNREKMWLCRCQCGKEVKVRRGSLTSGATQSCGCLHKEKVSTGYGYITGSWYSRIIKDAIARDLSFNISKEFLNDLFIKQNFKCALTGLDLEIKTGSKTTASLDRIDSNLGYEENNVQFVHKDINLMKQAYNEKYFIEMCRRVVNYSDTNY